MKKIKMNFVLDQSQIDYLKYRKQKTGASLAEVVRRLIDKEKDADEVFNTEKTKGTTPL